MKKITFFLVVLLFLIACSMPSIIATEAPALVALPTSPTARPFTSGLIISSPTPFPTLPPTLTPMPLPQTFSSNTIQFDLNGTWKDILDNVLSGNSKVYTLNAMQGQIMSVSVFAPGGDSKSFPIQVQGRDGTVLCPVEQNTECYFWRGALPISQDYFITVKSGGELTKFILRVAINPLESSEQTFGYNDPATGSRFLYSDQFAPMGLPSLLNNKTDLRAALQLIDTNSYVNTNLGEAYFAFGSSKNSEIVATCTDLNKNSGAPETEHGKELINGYNFTYSVAFDAGAGNVYSQHIYRMADRGVCYEAIFFIHYSNIDNYPPGVVKEFDQEGLLQKFKGILSTFKTK